MPIIPERQLNAEGGTYVERIQALAGISRASPDVTLYRTINSQLILAGTYGVMGLHSAVELIAASHVLAAEFEDRRYPVTGQRGVSGLNIAAVLARRHIQLIGSQATGIDTATFLNLHKSAAEIAMAQRELDERE